MKIQVINAIKNYHNRKVLDVDYIEFKPGYIYAVMGLNGSGKTTLLQSIAGINKLTNGEILYDGKDFKYIKDRITMMMQQPYLFDCSVKENIIMGLKFRKLDKDIVRSRIKSYIKYFDIDEIINQNSKKLSGGELAKVALLRTLIMETDIVLLDEPTASMDVESTILAEGLMKDIMNENRILIVVTHDLYQAERIADYVVFMDKGKIIEMGEKEKVFKDPKNHKLKLLLNK